MLLLIALALIVGCACGATLSFEMRTQEADRNSPRHWLIFGGLVVVVSLCAVAAEALNEAYKPAAAAKGLCVLFFAAAFGLSYWLVSRRRRSAQ